MKKLYIAPVIDEVGGVAGMTAAFGSSARPDFSEFPDQPASTGSFDACDSNPGNNTDPDFCGGIQ